MTQEITTARLISLLADEFARRGWRDPGDAALEVAKSLALGASPSSAARAAPANFLAANRIRRSDIASAIESVARRAGPRSAVDTTSRDASPSGSRPERQPGNGHTKRAPRRWTPPLAARLIAGLAILSIGTWAIWLGPPTVDWAWLEEHENRLALQALGQCVLLLASIGVATWRWPIAAAGAAPLFGLLALLGSTGPN